MSCNTGMYVCMYVRRYVCMYVRTYVCMYVNMPRCRVQVRKLLRHVLTSRRA